MDIYNYYKEIFLDCINSYNLSDELKFKIIVEKPIEELGIFEIGVELHSEVTAKIRLWVTKK